MTEHERWLAQQERELKLPKWAQQELVRLRQNLAASEKRVAAVEGLGATDVYLLKPGVFERAPLPRRSDIEFELGNEARIRVSIRDEDGGRFLDVSGAGHPSGIAVAPWASNHVRIYPRDY